MTVDCPHCGESLEFRASRPKFCAFCGHGLDESSLKTTAMSDREAPTLDHTPTSRDKDAARTNVMPEKVGGYRLVRPLGQGGMGTVYEAEESGFGRKVALKLLAPEITASREAIDRFRQEGRLASAISHPRCVFVLNADEEDGRPFIVMELMPGSNLFDLVQEKGPLPVDDAVPKILDVIEGLREAHRLGVIHRDVKPSNCFLESDGRVKIGDFGLSKSLVADNNNITRTGAFLGTPLYASPEQIKGESLDPRTDVYSVSATLYYLLAGRAPFQGSDAAATLAKIVSDPPPPIRSIRPDLSAELERIIHRGLERNRDRRWRNLGELASALLPFAPGRLRMGGLWLRIAAFVIDVNLSKFLIILAINVVLFAGMRGTKHSVIEDNFAIGAVLDPVLFLVFFFIIEPFWGASPGKWLLRLRVRGEGTSAPGPVVILKRNLIFWAIAALPWEVLALYFSLGGRGVHWAIYPARVAVMMALGLTMRASNGFAGVHDLLTRTRVVVLPSLHVRRATGARRALGRDRGIAARPVGVLKSIGPYRVRGAIRWEEGRKVLTAEESSLGREVWIVVRPRSSPAPDAPRRDLARPTRTRWLSGGEQAEGRWDAFMAPSGCPLADLAGAEGLPWRDARPILEDLADEMRAALRDGTLPGEVSVDQVWVQPDGHALLVDQLVMPAGDPSRADPRPPIGRARALLKAACVMMLEGGRRGSLAPSAPIRAAVPRHAAAILARLDDGPDAYESFDDLHADLSATQHHPLEVGHALRATHLGATAAALALPLVALLGLPWLRLSGWYDTHPAPDFLGRLGAFLLKPDRPLTPWVVVAIPATWVLWSFATRGGLLLSLFGMAVSRSDGRPASRFRCAFRSLVTWIVPASLLVGSVTSRVPGPSAKSLAWTAFGLAGTVVACFPILAMIRPSQGPQDLIAGTVVVPK